MRNFSKNNSKPLLCNGKDSTHIRNEIVEGVFNNYINNPNKNQTGILLINGETGKRTYISIGTKIKIICNDNKVIKGHLYVQNNSVLFINKNFISICDINKIKRQGPAGIIVTSIGGILILGGIALISESFVGAVFAFYGIFPTAIGLQMREMGN
jgi:hypothetical protein